MFCATFTSLFPSIFKKGEKRRFHFLSYLANSVQTRKNAMQQAVQCSKMINLNVVHWGQSESVFWVAFNAVTQLVDCTFKKYCSTSSRKSIACNANAGVEKSYPCQYFSGNTFWFFCLLIFSYYLFYVSFCSYICASTQPVRGLPRLRAPSIVPCIISFSRQFSCFLFLFLPSFLALTVSSSSLFTPALLRIHLFVFFAVHEIRRIFLSPFISKASKWVSSFFLSVQLSQPYVHTSAFISLIFVEIGMLWLFHIFCSDALIACPLFNLVRNSVVHSPSSVIRDLRPKVWEHIHLRQLFILNEYATRYAVARHYLGVVGIDE